jgi:hypothetical protein
MPEGADGRDSSFPKRFWDFWIDLFKSHGTTQELDAPVSQPRPQPRHQSLFYRFEEHVLQIRRPRSPEHQLSKITNSKSQISSKFQFQMTKQILFRISVIGIHLRFGAWDLLLPYGYAPCAMLIWFSRSSLLWSPSKLLLHHL